MVTYELAGAGTPELAGAGTPSFWVNIRPGPYSGSNWSSVCGVCYRPIYMGSLNTCGACGLKIHHMCVGAKIFRLTEFVSVYGCMSCSTYE